MKYPSVYLDGKARRAMYLSLPLRMQVNTVTGAKDDPTMPLTLARLSCQEIHRRWRKVDRGQVTFNKNSKISFSH